jgi:hypothetical protein
VARTFWLIEGFAHWMFPNRYTEETPHKTVSSAFAPSHRSYSHQPRKIGAFLKKRADSVSVG